MFQICYVVSSHFGACENSFLSPVFSLDDSSGAAQNGGKVSPGVRYIKTLEFLTQPLSLKKEFSAAFENSPTPPRPPTLCVKLKSNNALIPLAAAESHATLGPVMELGKFCTNRSSPLHSPALCCGCRGTA